MVHPDLLHQNETQCAKSIIKLTDRVYSAVGYAASTQHMIIGDSSLTIIDTSESTKAAENVLAAFREITDKPVARIIYTHSHRDHISGATVFSEGKEIAITAHHQFSSDLVNRDATAFYPQKALMRRTQAQFGFGLTNDQRVSLGCGPGDRPMEGMGAGHIPPNELIARDCEIDLDGVKAHLFFCPGETADHMGVWLPDHSVLMPGDNWYHAFPNLYAIRGTPYRDYQAWADSLLQLSSFDAEIMAPGHTRPVFGADQIKDAFLSTREAILHIMRHTSDGMNKNMPIDDIVSSFELPEAISQKPWLKEYYGNIAWSIRAFACGILGWYGGNPTELGTMPSITRAEHMAELSGGREALLTAARSSTSDLQWRLELCDHLMRLNISEARALKAETMEILAEGEINATARNTYFWEAKALRAES